MEKPKIFLKQKYTNIKNSVVTNLDTNPQIILDSEGCWENITSIIISKQEISNYQ